MTMWAMMAHLVLCHEACEQTVSTVALMIIVVLGRSNIYGVPAIESRRAQGLAAAHAAIRSFLRRRNVRHAWR